MTNNENKSKEIWSLKKTILFIVLVVLLFATLFSCGLNTFKTTYNQVNQVNYEEKNDLLTDYTSFNKVDRGIKNANNNGVVVPNNSYVEKIYFNTQYQTMNDLMNYMFSNGVTINDFNMDSEGLMNILFCENYDKYLYFNVLIDSSTQTPNAFYIQYIDTSGSSPHFVPICMANSTTNYEISWYYDMLYLGTNCIPSVTLDGVSFNVGNINSKITDFMSITPFDSGGSSYTPNPQYDIVQPNINGDLVLGTMFEPMLEQQTTFGELYVSYIIGASEYTYSLNIVINLVLEGANNYINVPISTSLNINDLSNSSYTQIIANFDSELEELNLVIEVYSNSSVIYTYNNSFPCVMNNSFTYPYQVIGFSNTATAKQYVSSYNSTQAYNNGFNLGNREGYSSGYDVGYDEGYDLGYDEGYNFTDDKGHYRGYEQGYHDGSNNEFAKDGVKDLVNIIFNAPYNIFNGFLNFEIFGVNLFNLLSFIFTLVLVGWIIALLMKR